MSHITVPETYAYGMGMLQRHVATLVPAVFVTMAAGSVIGYVGSKMGPLAFVGSILGFLVSSFLGSNVMQMALDLHDGKQAQLADVFKPHPRLVPYLVTSFVVALAVGLGTVLLVIPGIVAAVLLAFALPLVLDRGLDVGGALGGSVALAKPHVMQIVGFAALAFVANLIGAIPMGLGLLATVPLTLMAFVRLYRSYAAERR